MLNNEKEEQTGASS